MAGAPGPDERKYQLGRCTDGSPCIWNCTVPDALDKTSCQSPSAQCVLAPTVGFAARLRISADPDDSRRLTVAMAGKKSDGSTFTIPDFTFSFGGNIGCSERGQDIIDTNTCASDNNEPRRTVFLCATDNFLEIPADFWLDGSTFPKDVADAIKANFPGVSGVPAIVKTPKQVVENDPLSDEFCIQAGFVNPSIPGLGALGTPTPEVSSESSLTGLGDCGGPGSCAAAPLPNCKGSVASGGKAGAVVLKTKADKKIFKWKLGKGDAVAPSEFGDPLDGDPVRVCIYDATPRLVFAAPIPAGGTCDGKDCWEAAKKGNGFVYADKSSSQLGINKIVLYAGPVEKSRLSASGKGSSLPILHDPPYAMPVRVQLQAAGGCWETTHASAGTNEPTKFSAKAD